MALTEFRHGGLHIIQAVSSKDEINRQLRELDAALFVEKQLTLDQEAVWCVVEDRGSAYPPVTVYEFRDERGRPIPELTERVVEVMKMRAQAGLDPQALLNRIDAKNAAREAERKGDMREGLDQSLKEWETMRRGQPVVPRSRGLYLSRAKQRAKGKRDGEF